MIHSMFRINISLLSILIVGCSSWPDKGQGGDAQLDTSHEYYIDQVDGEVGESLETKGALATQWSIHNLKLDNLVLRGAKNCLPARVREISMVSRRSKRELDSNLLEDARNTVIILQKKLDELERRLIYVKRNTRCDVSRGLAIESYQLTDHEKYLNRKRFLLELLNDEYCFDRNSFEVAPYYREKLTIAGHYLKQDGSIKLYINGHTDSRGSYRYNQELALKRARSVKEILVASGVGADRLNLRTFGEQLPIESNGDVIGQMKNRRVSIEFMDEDYFHISGRNGELFEQQFDLFGRQSKTTQEDGRVKTLKEWNHEF